MLERLDALFQRQFGSPCNADRFVKTHLCAGRLDGKAGIGAEIERRGAVGGIRLIGWAGLQTELRNVELAAIQRERAIDAKEWRILLLRVSDLDAVRLGTAALLPRLDQPERAGIGQPLGLPQNFAIRVERHRLRCGIGLYP